MKVQAILVSLVLLGGVSAFSEEEVVASGGTAVTYDSILDAIEEPQEGIITTGKIETLDLSERTAIIGGYKYHFGPATEAQPLIVKMLGRDFGSLQLMAPGMHVQVDYIASPAGDRVGFELIEIEASEEH